MAKVYVVHGYTATPENHWFPWLKQQLLQQNIACECLAMPDSARPNVDKWLSHLEQHIEIDGDTVVVGHSLGCVALLNFLAKHYHQPAGAVFVSGFYQPVETLPELTPFSNLYAISPDLMPFKSYVVSACDDEIVPPKYSDALAVHLEADYIRFAKGGHFLDREGWTGFPLVLELVKKCLAND